MFNRYILIVASAVLGGACTETMTPPGATSASAAGENTSPPDAPLKYTVLLDNPDPKANAVDFHVLVGESPKHDDVEKLLKYLYRHLMMRREPQPIALSANVYSNEAQFKTPPRTPVATVMQKSGEIGPTFENKVPFELWQEIEIALFGDDEKERQRKVERNKTAKLAIKTQRNDVTKALTLTFPFTEGLKDEWAETLSFNQALNNFTATAQSLFEKVPELAKLSYVGTWSPCKEHAPSCPAEDMVKIELDRETYHALKLNELEEKMGQAHGRAYLEMSAGRGSDAAISKANAARMAGLYKTMLGQLKGRAWVSPKLK